jgi:hypothetical protein
MISLLAYLKHIARQAANTLMLMWSNNRDTLYLRGQPIQLSAFQAMVTGLLQEAEDYLWEELLWTPAKGDRFQIPLGFRTTLPSASVATHSFRILKIT